jgi:hypothetical protein
MRKRAEAKFQKDVITPIETQREKLAITSENQLNNLLNDLVMVYKYNVHKIYLN